MGKMQEDVQNAQAEWDAARVRPDTFGATFEDGTYTMRLTDAFRGESMSSGRDQVTFEWTFLDGQNAGQTHRSFHGLDTEDGMFYCCQVLNRLGYDSPALLADLETTLGEMKADAPVAQVRLKTNVSKANGQEYQNTYVNKAIAFEGNAGASPTPTASFESLVGQSVAFPVDGADVTGKVTAQDNDILTVEVGDDEYEVSFDEAVVIEPKPAAKKKAKKKAKAKGRRK